MIAEDRRLAALLAVFAPAGARALAARLAAPGAPDLAALAGRLAVAPRRERLASLEAALAEGATPPPAAAWDALARGERPAVARALAAAPPGCGAEPLGGAAVLVRLARERLAGSAARPARPPAVPRGAGPAPEPTGATAGAPWHGP